MMSPQKTWSTGEVIDAKGYVCAGQNVGDIASRDHLITRALIKGLKTHVKALTNRHTVNAIALLRNPKTVREALASPEYSQWIAAIHAEMSSLIDKHTFDVCPIPQGRKVIPTKLVLKIKIGSDGRIDKFKARCCVLGFRQTKARHQASPCRQDSAGSSNADCTAPTNLAPSGVLLSALG